MPHECRLQVADARVRHRRRRRLKAPAAGGGGQGRTRRHPHACATSPHAMQAGLGWRVASTAKVRAHMARGGWWRAHNAQALRRAVSAAQHPVETSRAHLEHGSPRRGRQRSGLCRHLLRGQEGCAGLQQMQRLERTLRVGPAGGDVGCSTNFGTPAAFHPARRSLNVAFCPRCSLNASISHRRSLSESPRPAAAHQPTHLCRPQFAGAWHIGARQRLSAQMGSPERALRGCDRLRLSALGGWGGWQRRVALAHSAPQRLCAPQGVISSSHARRRRGPGAARRRLPGVGAGAGAGPPRGAVLVVTGAACKLKRAVLYAARGSSTACRPARRRRQSLGRGEVRPRTSRRPNAAAPLPRAAPAPAGPRLQLPGHLPAAQVQVRVVRHPRRPHPRRGPSIRRAGGCWRRGSVLRRGGTTGGGGHPWARVACASLAAACPALPPPQIHPPAHPGLCCRRMTTPSPSPPSPSSWTSPSLLTTPRAAPSPPRELLPSAPICLPCPALPARPQLVCTVAVHAQPSLLQPSSSCLPAAGL